MDRLVLSSTAGGSKMIQPLLKTVWQFLLKLKIYLPLIQLFYFSDFTYNRNGQICTQSDLNKNIHGLDQKKQILKAIQLPLLEELIN